MTQTLNRIQTAQNFGSRPSILNTPDRKQGPERRSHDRITTNFRATIFCHDRFQTVTIKNVSCGGVMMADAFGLAVGDKAVLSMLTGHPYVGKVAWSVAPYTGLAFMTPIDLSDPLFRQRLKHTTFTES